MDGERSSRVSPYNTVMNTELKISVRENVSLPAASVNDISAINCDAKLSNITLVNNPYSEIQVSYYCIIFRNSIHSLFRLPNHI